MTLSVSDLNVLSKTKCGRECAVHKTEQAKYQTKFKITASQQDRLQAIL